MTLTSHGHHIPGSPRGDDGDILLRRRCGGPAICKVCQKDVARFLTPDTPDLEIDAFFEDIDGYEDDADRYLTAAKLFVVQTYNDRFEDPQAHISIKDLYIVWFSKTLQNWKAMVSTAISGDGLYFEITHNGDKHETYVDTYLKVSNVKYTSEGSN